MIKPFQQLQNLLFFRKDGCRFVFFFIDGLDLLSQVRPFFFAFCAKDVGGEIRRGKRQLMGNEKRAFRYILQFSDVAGPLVGGEVIEKGFIGNGNGRETGLCQLGKEVSK